MRNVSLKVLVKSLKFLFKKGYEPWACELERKEVVEPVGIDSNASFRYTPSGMFYDRSIVTVCFNTSFKKGEQVKYSYSAPLDVSRFWHEKRFLGSGRMKVFEKMLTGCHCLPFFARSLFYCSLAILAFLFRLNIHVGKWKSWNFINTV